MTGRITTTYFGMNSKHSMYQKFNSRISTFSTEQFFDKNPKQGQITFGANKSPFY
jgi:hypothetical protein